MTEVLLFFDGVYLLHCSEGEYETFYYSYPSHLDELIKCLKEDGHEKPLVQTLEEKYDIITHQMKCTEDLTNAAKGRPICSILI